MHSVALHKNKEERQMISNDRNHFSWKYGSSKISMTFFCVGQIRQVVQLQITSHCRTDRWIPFVLFYRQVLAFFEHKSEIPDKVFCFNLDSVIELWFLRLTDVHCFIDTTTPFVIFVHFRLLHPKEPAPRYPFILQYEIGNPKKRKPNYLQIQINAFRLNLAQQI